MSGSICFVETLRGQVHNPVQSAGTALCLQDLQVAICATPPQGMAGMQGCITGGRVLAACIGPHALNVLGGRVDILRQTSAFRCEMRYDMLCAVLPTAVLAGTFPLLRVQGVKDVSHRSGHCWPRALWVETTTLRLDLYEVPAGTTLADFLDQPSALPAQPLASGVVRLHVADFLRLLRTLRSHSPQGAWAALRNLCSFVYFFAARLLRVYAGPSRRA